MRECTHLPCLWPHRCPRHRDHFVTSSTPFLARSGLEALATVRVEEDTGAVPRSATGSVAFGRNEDRVHAAPAVSRAKCANKNAHEHTGSAETLRPSLRNGFTAYSELSPVNGSFATVARERRASRELDASTAASGPHDFAVRLSHTRQSQLARPSHLTARS